MLQTVYAHLHCARCDDLPKLTEVAKNAEKDVAWVQGYSRSSNLASFERAYEITKLFTVDAALCSKLSKLSHQLQCGSFWLSLLKTQHFLYFKISNKLDFIRRKAAGVYVSTFLTTFGLIITVTFNPLTSTFNRFIVVRK